MALEASTIALADPSLLRQPAYIDGEWSDADAGEAAHRAQGVQTRYLSLGGIAE